mgnify:FL=1
MLGFPVEDEEDGERERGQDGGGGDPDAGVEGDEEDVLHEGGGGLADHEADGVGVALLDEVDGGVAVGGEEDGAGLDLNVWKNTSIL